MIDIVESLRERDQMIGGWPGLYTEAADEIASLRARLAEVEGERLMDAFRYGVLIGFKYSAEGYNGEHPGDTPTETILEHVEDYDADMILEGIAALEDQS